MFGQYTDLIISIIVLIEFLIIILLISKTKTLEDKNKILESENRDFKKNNRLGRVTNTRILNIIELNTEDITCLKKQMQQVHGWLGDVLTIGDFINNESHELEKINIIEDLRQRVAWNKEIQSKQQFNDSDFYKGE